MRSRPAMLLFPALGLAGVFLLFWAFPKVYPLTPKDWDVSAPEARAIALEALRDLGDPVDDPFVVVEVDGDPLLERRLQLLAPERGAEALARSRLGRAQLLWTVLVYPPGAQPRQWTYRALIAPDGEILSLRRRDEDAAESALDDEAVRRLGTSYLLARGMDLDSLEAPGEVLRQRAGNRNDLRWQLRAREAVLGDDYPYGVEVYFSTDRVAGFGLWFEDPAPEDIQKSLRQVQIFGIGKIVLLYLILPFLAIVFLKHYHDGQLGVRRGVQILLVVLGAAILYVLINQGADSEGTNIGFITRRQTAWIIGGFTLIFAYSTAAAIALMSWSVGELFCRHQAPTKLASLDALFRLKWQNATVARSALHGVSGGAVMAGLQLALAVPAQGQGAWAVSDVFYSSAMGHPLGWLSMLVESFADTVPLYLFAAFLVPAWITKRFNAKLGVAAAWLALTFIATPLIVLPLEINAILWAVVAVIPAALFYFCDVLAVVLAGILSSVLLKAVPGFFAGDPLLEINAYAAVFLAALPLVVSLRFLLAKDEFAYTYDDVPPHVRRIAERERQRVELETAAEIQTSILPELPEQLNGVEIACAYLPATEVGGDFYDVLALEDGRLAVAVGDVAGHGVSSGLVMSMAKSALAVQVTFDPEVEAVFRTLNRMVYQSARRRLLTTLCYALVDPRRRELYYASAGHLYPYQVSLAGTVHTLETASYPLGVRGAIDVEVRTVKLGPSDMIFMCSDGLVEACPDGSDEPFGFDRLEASLKRHAGKTPREIKDSVRADVEGYVKGRPWEDDLTILVLRMPAD